MNEHSAEPPDPPNTSEPPGDLTAVAAIHAAVEQLAAVTGRQPEGATGVKAGPGRWLVGAGRCR